MKRKGSPCFQIMNEKQKLQRNKYNQKARDVKRDIIKKAKDIPCKDCGMEYPHYVMHFDHVKGNKVESVARFVSQPSYTGRLGIEALLEEIEKCEVVCANCHAIRHAFGGEW
jgi:hypothetical protein